MKIDLRQRRLPQPRLPDEYRWIPWRRVLLERHALVKWQAFRNDLDGQVFPSLGDLDGCRRLMNEITSQPRFCPSATWLLTRQPTSEDAPQDCASIQGILRRNCIGAIQNVGVIPEHRCKGLGRSLVLQALHGFRFSGMHHGVLEVTSENRIAVNLYESMGFEICEVLYRNSSTGEVVSELPE